MGGLHLPESLRFLNTLHLDLDLDKLKIQIQPTILMKNGYAK